MCRIIRRLVCAIIGHKSTEIDRVYTRDTVTVFYYCHRCQEMYAVVRKERREGVLRTAPMPATYERATVRQPDGAREERPDMAAPTSDAAVQEEEKPKEMPRDEHEFNRRGAMYCGERLTAWMNATGIGWTELVKTGLFSGDISSHRTNRKRMTHGKIRQYAAAFGITAEEFLAGPEKKGMYHYEMCVREEENTAMPVQTSAEGKIRSQAELPDTARESAAQKYTSNMRNIGWQLRMWMATKNKRTCDVARSTGINSADVSSYKTGNKCPGLKTIERLSDYFGVTVEEFLAGPPMKKQEPQKTPEKEAAKGAKEKPQGTQKETGNINRPEITVKAKTYLIGDTLEKWMAASGKGYDDVRRDAGLPLDKLNGIVDNKIGVTIDLLTIIASIFHAAPHEFLRGPNSGKPENEQDETEGGTRDEAEAETVV